MHSWKRRASTLLCWLGVLGLVSSCGLVHDEGAGSVVTIPGPEAERPVATTGGDNSNRTGSIGETDGSQSETSQPDVQPTTSIPDIPGSIDSVEVGEIARPVPQVDYYFPLEIVDPGNDFCLAVDQMYRSGQNLLGLASYAPVDATGDFDRYRAAIIHLAKAYERQFGAAQAAILERFVGFLGILDPANGRALLRTQIMGYLGDDKNDANTLLNSLTVSCPAVMPMPQSPMDKIQTDLNGGGLS